MTVTDPFRRDVQLRASLVWHDEVMGDVVLDKPRAITVGPAPYTTFTTPNVGLPGMFSIIKPGARGYLLTLGAGMGGRIFIDGVQHDVRDFVGGGDSNGNGNDFRATPLGPRDWGVIELDRDAAFKLFFQFVPVEAPLPAPSGSASDEGLIPALAFALLLHTILLVVAYTIFPFDFDDMVWPGPREMTGDYLVTRIDDPPPPPEKVLLSGKAGPEAAAKTGDVPKVKSATKGAEGKSGGEGKTERARDPSASDDDKPAPPKVSFFEDKNRAMLDNVINTNLDVPIGNFRGIKGEARRGDLGFGAGKGTGVGVGEGTGTRRGSKGTGSGGGGSAEGDFVSSGKIDAGETRAPKGSGGTGSGVKEVAVVGTGTATGDFGGLTRDEIDRMIKANAGRIKVCYQKELNKVRGLGGKLVVNFTIGGDGVVKDSRINGGASSLRNAEVESCVKRQIAKIKFPAKGGVSVVNYPFIFSQG